MFFRNNWLPDTVSDLNLTCVAGVDRGGGGGGGRGGGGELASFPGRE